MSARTEEEKLTPTPVYFVPEIAGKGDVSFLVLIQVFVRKKWIVFFSLLAGLLLAFVYLNIVEPIYQAEIHLLPPQQKSVQELTVYINGMHKQYTPDDVYKKFIINIRSLGLRREFFSSQDLSSYYASDKKTSEYELFDDSFNEKLIVVDGSGDLLSVNIKFQYTNPELAAEWLNKFVSFINDRTVSQLRESVQSEVNSEVARLEDKLLNVLTSADGRKKDEIVRLEEALGIARVLGLTESSVPSTMSAKDRRGVAVNTVEIPLYMRGVKALEEEITALEIRKSNKSFASDYRDVEQKILMLKSIEIDPEFLSSVRIDMDAIIPYKTEYPKRIKVFVLFCLMGLILGVGVVGMLELVKVTRSNLKVLEDS